MPQTQLMTNEQVLKAAGVTDDMITAIKTADATTAVNTLDQVYKILMSFVSEQRIEWANLRNPLESLEKGYAVFNGGSLNGMFQETLIPPNAKGADGLYNGKAHVVANAPNPWDNQYYGTTPIQYTYGINCTIDRHVDQERNAFLMFLKEYSLIDFMKSSIQILEANGNGSRYAIENNVLNCEAFQYKTYATCPVWSNAADLNAFMYKVYKMQSFPESNMQYKKTPFNTTRRNGDLVFVLDSEFAFEFASKFQFSSYLKPFMYKTTDRDGYETQAERSRVIEVDALTPTQLPAGSTGDVFDPLKLTAATLPANTKLVGRIIDVNATKFGIGAFDATSFPLSARVMHYDESRDYVFNMCPAYVNVPILISDDFKADRIISIVDTTPAPDPTPGA